MLITSTQTYTVGPSIQDSLARFFLETGGYKQAQASQLARTATVRVVEIFNNPSLGIKLFCSACSQFSEDCKGHTVPGRKISISAEVRRWCFLVEEYDRLRELVKERQVVLPTSIDDYFVAWIDWSTE